MGKIFCIVLFISIIGLCPNCKSTKNVQSNQSEASTIVYILPDTVNKLLAKEIVRENTYYLEIWNEENYFRVFLHKSPLYNKKDLIHRSNRKVHLNGLFYPIIFDYDNIFSIPESEGEVLNAFSTDKYPSFSKRRLIHEGSFYVIFTKKGGGNC